VTGFLSTRPDRRLATCRSGRHARTIVNTAVTGRGTRDCLDCRRESKARAARKLDGLRVEIRCPGCGLVRILAGRTAKRYHLGRGADGARLCKSCARKSVRGKTKFRVRQCARCRAEFSGRSGAARFCDSCAGRTAQAPKACPVCGKSFVRYRNAIACSDPCRRRLKWNKSYFGGRLFDAVGWAQRECQLCGRVVAKKAHVHHVFGHPDHSALVVLCAGCHDVVSTLARRSTYQDEQFRRLRWFVAAQRDGAAPAGRDPEPWQGITE